MTLPHQQVQTPNDLDTPQCPTWGLQNKGHLVLGLAVLWDPRLYPLQGSLVGLSAQPCTSHTESRPQPSMAARAPPSLRTSSLPKHLGQGENGLAQGQVHNWRIPSLESRHRKGQGGARGSQGGRGAVAHPRG